MDLFHQRLGSRDVFYSPDALLFDLSAATDPETYLGKLQQQAGSKTLHIITNCIDLFSDLHDANLTEVRFKRLSFDQRFLSNSPPMPSIPERVFSARERQDIEYAAAVDLLLTT